MTEAEYNEIQYALTKKLKNHKGYSSNREEEYNNGILAAKSIIKSIYKSQTENG